MSTALLVSGLVMGLFGGGHCVAMCGGVSSVVCANGAKSPRYALAYNAGRTAAYTILGLVAGALGTGAFLGRIGLPVDAARFGLRTAAALCLLTVGLHLAGLPSFVRALESVGAPLWRRLAPLAKRLLPLRSPSQALAVGGLWAFMPCGLLYGALALAASAESPILGAATMLAFALGTWPAMLTVGLFAERVTRSMKTLWVRRIAGAAVLAMGLWSTAGLVQQVGAQASPHACCPHR